MISNRQRQELQAQIDLMVEEKTTCDVYHCGFMAGQKMSAPRVNCSGPIDGTAPASGDPLGHRRKRGA